jgi:hypothetical protein
MLAKRYRVVLFGAIVVGCLVSLIGYTTLAARRVNTPPPSADQPSDAETLARIAAQPHLMFLHSPSGDAYRQVAIMPLDALDGPRYLTPLVCQRTYMAAGQGLCLTDGLTASRFGADFRPSQAVQQPGIPTRARVSPDGRRGAMTWFVAGHSYADARFSTQTTLVDLQPGDALTNLEQFTILRDDAQFRAVDFNFWGVTFGRDSNRFYATLASGGRTYLIDGDVARREGRILRENVECPSISPDNTRLAFKERIDPTSPNRWRLAILDLRNQEVTHVTGEVHSVDDQVEWLDDGHILYALQDEGPPATIAQDIWVATLDDSQPPRRLLKGALSPAVVR